MFIGNTYFQYNLTFIGAPSGVFYCITGTNFYIISKHVTGGNKKPGYLLHIMMI